MTFKNYSTGEDAKLLKDDLPNIMRSVIECGVNGGIIIKLENGSEFHLYKPEREYMYFIKKLKNSYLDRLIRPFWMRYEESKDYVYQFFTFELKNSL